MEILSLLYAVGELLTTTWPGQIVLAVAVVSAVSKIIK